MEDLSIKSCRIRDPEPLPENPVPAMSYIPFQQFGETFDALRAFEAGTLFPELNKPFLGGAVK